MLLWDKQLRPWIPVIAKLDQAQRFTLAMACIDDVREVFDCAVRPLASPEAKRFFASAFALLSDIGMSSQLPRAASQLLVAEASWMDSAPPGVWDMGMALLCLMKRGGGYLSADDVTEILSASYQVLLQVEVLSKLDEEVTESEVARLEEGNEACVACITAQLRHITGAKTE